MGGAADRHPAAARDRRSQTGGDGDEPAGSERRPARRQPAAGPDPRPRTPAAGDPRGPGANAERRRELAELAPDGAAAAPAGVASPARLSRSPRLSRSKRRRAATAENLDRPPALLPVLHQDRSAGTGVDEVGEPVGGAVEGVGAAVLLGVAAAGGPVGAALEDRGRAGDEAGDRRVVVGQLHARGHVPGVAEDRHPGGDLDRLAEGPDRAVRARVRQCRLDVREHPHVFFVGAG